MYDKINLKKLIDFTCKNKIKIVLFIGVLITLLTYYNLHYGTEFFFKIASKRVNTIIKRTDNDKNFYIREDCIYLIPKTIKDIITETIDNFKFNLYLPCQYDDLDIEYEKFKYDLFGVYFIIDNTDMLASKSTLAQKVINNYGRNNNLIPKTWVIEHNEDNDKFIHEFEQNKLYILKKNIQRQQDITISRNLADILQLIKKSESDKYKYVVIQELLQNPYLIDGRKINLRVYILLVKFGDEYRIYMYNDGFMYYTAERYKPDSDDLKVNITTGYIDREVYEKNPLTLKDLRKYLNSESRPLNEKEKKIKRFYLLSEYLFNNIQNLIRDVFVLYKNDIGNGTKLKENKKFQIFGTDIAVDDELNVKLMEINKGPDLDAKDKRDSELKHNLVRDIFKTVNLIEDDTKNDFVRIYYE
jgi:hypothetical protein